MKDVPRERTLVIMAGKANQFSLWNSHNPYIPGSNNGFHSGTLPAMFEPLIMFDVLGDHPHHKLWLPTLVAMGIAEDFY